MDFAQLNILLNGASVIFLLAGGVIYYKSALSANTLKLYKENQEAQSVRLDSLTDQLKQSRADQALMKEEIRVIKTLPLDSILATLNAVMETQNAILSTQNKILHQLEANPTGQSVTIQTGNPK